jgi:hypothetical protein
MSGLPSTLWGAINRAKLDLRKFHLEKNQTKKEALKKKAILSMANADKVVGPGPHRFISTRQDWRKEILFLNYYEDDDKIGRYWQDDKDQWNLESIPLWATNPNMKVQEPLFGSVISVQGANMTYVVRPEHQDR